MIAKHGGKWRPVDRKEIGLARRALLKMTAEYTVEFVRTMYKFSAANIEDIEALVGTPSIRARISQRGFGVREILGEWRNKIDAYDRDE